MNSETPTAREVGTMISIHVFLLGMRRAYRLLDGTYVFFTCSIFLILDMHAFESLMQTFKVIHDFITFCLIL